MTARCNSQVDSNSVYKTNYNTFTHYTVMAKETAKPVGIGKNTYETWKVAINPNDEWLRAEVVGAVVAGILCTNTTNRYTMSCI